MPDSGLAATLSLLLFARLAVCGVLDIRPPSSCVKAAGAAGQPAQPRQGMHTLDHWLGRQRRKHTQNHEKDSPDEDASEKAEHGTNVGARTGTRARTCTSTAALNEAGGEISGLVAEQVMQAAREGRVEAVRRLIVAHGIDVNVPLPSSSESDGFGQTITLMEVADHYGHAPLAAMLMSLGATLEREGSCEEEDSWAAGSEEWKEGEGQLRKGEGAEMVAAWEYGDMNCKVHLQPTLNGAGPGGVPAGAVRGWVVGPDGPEIRNDGCSGPPSMPDRQREALRGYGGKILFEGDLAMKGSEWAEAMCLFSQAVRLWTSVCDETPATFLDEGLAGNMGASDVAANIQLLDETSADWQQLRRAVKGWLRAAVAAGDVAAARTAWNTVVQVGIGGNADMAHLHARLSYLESSARV